MNQLPLDIIKYLLPYDKRFVVRKGQIIQINQIPKHDKRYELLASIPQKEYIADENLTFVYLDINENKDFYLTYCDNEIQLQSLLYIGNCHIKQLDAYRYILP